MFSEIYYILICNFSFILYIYLSIFNDNYEYVFRDLQTIYAFLAYHEFDRQSLSLSLVLFLKTLPIEKLSMHFFSALRKPKDSLFRLNTTAFLHRISLIIATTQTCFFYSEPFLRYENIIESNFPLKKANFF